MGGQRAKTKNNALITQFFQKAPAPAAPLTKPTLSQHQGQSAVNDENALTESEIAYQNRRAMQRGGLSKKKPVFRHALAQVVHEDGDDMKRVVLGGLKNMDNAPLLARREPAFSVLSDNADASDRATKKPVATKGVAMPKGWDCDEGVVVAAAAAASTTNKASDGEEKDTIKAENNRFEKTMLKERSNLVDTTACILSPEKEHIKKPTVPGRQDDNDTATTKGKKRVQQQQPSVEAERETLTEKQEAHSNDEKEVPKKRLVEDDLLITTTKRKVLGPKPPIRRQQSEEDDVQKEELSSKIPHSPSFFDDNDNESIHNEAQLSPLEFSISNPSVPHKNSHHHSSSPTPEASSDELNTIPLTHPENYEEYPAFPVPRGKTLVEKLGIEEDGERQEEKDEEATSISSSPLSYII